MTIGGVVALPPRLKRPKGDDMLEYVDQSADGLRFYLLKGEVDVERYTVLERTSFQWHDHEVEMGILGASHFLKIKLPDGTILNEIFACAEIHTTLPLITSGPLGELRSQVLCNLNGFGYQFTPRILDWSVAEMELFDLHTISVRQKQSESEHALCFQFPSKNSSSKPPLTLLHANAGGVLTIKSAHCYPNENNIVFTETTLTKGGSNR